MAPTQAVSELSGNLIVVGQTNFDGVMEGFRGQKDQGNLYQSSRKSSPSSSYQKGALLLGIRGKGAKEED